MDYCRNYETHFLQYTVHEEIVVHMFYNCKRTYDCSEKKLVIAENFSNNTNTSKQDLQVCFAWCNQS